MNSRLDDMKRNIQKIEHEAAQLAQRALIVEQKLQIEGLPPMPLANLALQQVNHFPA
jgi:hypothetical protein